MERVLKKPFRPPKINLAKAKLKNENEPAKLSAGKANSEDGEIESKSPRSSPRPAPFPLASSPSSGSSQYSRNPTKLHKPFKTPARKTDLFDRSMAPSPTISSAPPSSPLPAGKKTSMTQPKKTIKSARPTGGGINLAPAKPPSQRVLGAHADRAKIFQLENRIRHIQEALRYITNDEEEQRHETETQLWLTVGREVAEKLFKQLPAPDQLPGQESSLASMGYSGGFRSWGWDEGPTTPAQMGYGSFADCAPPLQRDRVYAPTYPRLTDGQRSALARAKRNEDGDAVDDEGNSLFGDGGDMDLDEIAQASITRGKKGEKGLYVSSLGK